MPIEDLYQEVILDHYKQPRNKRRLPGASVSCSRNNPLCGDEITIEAVLADGRIDDVTFEGVGCSISQASASMLTETVKGRSLEEAAGAAGEFRSMMEGAADPDEDRMGDLVALQGVRKYPMRIKRAILAWDVLEEAIGSGRGAASGTAPH